MAWGRSPGMSWEGGCFEFLACPKICIMVTRPTQTLDCYVFCYARYGLWHTGGRCYTWFWALKATLTRPELGFFSTVLSSRWTIQAQMVSKILHTCSKYFTLGRANNILEAGPKKQHLGPTIRTDWLEWSVIKTLNLPSFSLEARSYAQYSVITPRALPSRKNQHLFSKLVYFGALKNSTRPLKVWLFFSLILTIYISKSIC